MNEQDILQDIDENIRILVLVTGVLEDGSAHWAYASVAFIQYEAFKAAEKQGNYDLSAYGRILEHGAGSEPSAEIIQKMKDEYGADHKFEQELEQIM
jgi:hypothetical protein